MKSEDQVIGKLETAVDELTKLNEEVVKNQWTEETIPEEVKIKVLVTSTAMFLLIWFLDQEEVLEPVLVQMKIAGIMQKLKKATQE